MITILRKLSPLALLIMTVSVFAAEGGIGISGGGLNGLTRGGDRGDSISEVAGSMRANFLCFDNEREIVIRGAAIPKEIQASASRGQTLTCQPENLQ